ncbi:MAG: alpha/beta fold hydrolase [Gaiellaceae bacterium]
MRRRLLGLMLGLVGAAAALGFRPSPASATVPLAPCAANGLLCGSVSVPLDYSGQTPGSLSLYAEELPAPDFSRGVMFLLAGGPGQASAETFDLAHQGAFWQSVFPGYTLVAYDDRGTGKSGALDCSRAASIAACADEIGPSRIFYATRDHAEDIESIRQALGFDRIGLYGGSYGTKHAMAYALAHPQHVERLLLDSVLPPEGPDPFGTSYLHAIPLALDSICHDGGCRSVSADPVADFARLANRNGGRPDLLQLMIESDIDVGIGPEVPNAVSAALAGRSAALARLFAIDRAWTSPLLPGINVALELATVCNDGPFPWGAAASTDERLAGLQAATSALAPEAFGPFGSWATQIGNAPVCATWPAPTGQAPLAAGPLPDVPVLALEGDRDVRTPIVGGASVAARFAQGHVLVVQGAGHSVLKRSDCAASAVRGWLDGGTPASICSRLPSAAPVGPLPASVAAARPARGVRGRAGRTLAAVVATLQEAEAAFAFLNNLSQVSGIQGGSMSPTVTGAAAIGKVKLSGYSDVSGLALSGTLSCKPAGSFYPQSFTPLSHSLSGKLTISGAGSAHGALRVAAGKLSGTLAGKRVSATL